MLSYAKVRKVVLPVLIVGGAVALFLSGCNYPSGARLSTQPSPTPVPSASPGSSPAAEGKILFDTAGNKGTGCAYCHGPLGQGNANGSGAPSNVGASATMITSAMTMSPMNGVFTGQYALTQTQINDLAAYLAAPY